MKKNLPIYILLIFLMLVNGFFLFNHLKRSSKNKPKGSKNFIIKQLNFDASQIEKFNKLEDGHWKRMRIISDVGRSLTNALFDKVSDLNIKEKQIDSITTLIGLNEKEKETEVFNHFKNIRELCDEQQKEKFNSIVKDAIHKGRKKGRRHPRK